MKTDDAASENDQGRPEKTAAPVADSVRPSSTEHKDASVDLSLELAKTLARSPGERVTCRRISGNRYRCNWWTPQNKDGFDNPAMSGLTVTTHRVSKSAFLHVTRTAEGLVISTSLARGGTQK